MTIDQHRVLIEGDPVGRPIAGCTFAAPGNPPCLLTLAVKKGYSSFVTIGGRPVCLDTVTGLTNGFQPGTWNYKVKNAGQGFVRSAG